MRAIKASFAVAEALLALALRLVPAAEAAPAPAADYDAIIANAHTKAANNKLSTQCITQHSWCIHAVEQWYHGGVALGGDEGMQHGCDRAQVVCLHTHENEVAWPNLLCTCGHMKVFGWHMKVTLQKCAVCSTNVIINNDF